MATFLQMRDLVAVAEVDRDQRRPHAHHTGSNAASMNSATSRLENNTVLTSGRWFNKAMGLAHREDEHQLNVFAAARALSTTCQ